MAFYQLSSVQHSRYRLLLPGKACELSLQKLHDIFSRKGSGDKLADVFNTVLVILVLRKVPDFEGYISALRNNSKHARFWSLFAQLMIAVGYNIIVTAQKHLV